MKRLSRLSKRPDTAFSPSAEVSIRYHLDRTSVRPRLAELTPIAMVSGDVWTPTSFGPEISIAACSARRRPR